MTTARRATWIDNPSHHRWLVTQTDALLDFYRRGCPDPVDGGFWWLDATGRPDRSQGKQLWIDARMVYAFSLGSLLGHPGCGPLFEHGLDCLVSQGRVQLDALVTHWFSLADAASAITAVQRDGSAFKAVVQVSSARAPG